MVTAILWRTSAQQRFFWAAQHKILVSKRKQVKRGQVAEAPRPVVAPARNPVRLENLRGRRRPRRARPARLFLVRKVARSGRRGTRR